MTDKFSLLANIASDWWWEMDADLRFTFFSDRRAELSGWPLERLLGKRRDELGYTNHSEAEWRAHLDDLANHRPFHNFETTFLDANGASRYLRISGTPLFAADGRFEGYIGVSHDITELRRREKEAADHAATLDAILQNIEQGVVLLDETLKVIDYNKRMVELLGFEDIKSQRGRAFENVLRDLGAHGLFGTEDPEGIVEARLRILQSRKRVVVERERGDGRFISLAFIPLPAGGHIATYSDVTEARRREAQLRELAEQLEQERTRLVIAQSVAKVGSWEMERADWRPVCSAELFKIAGVDPATFSPSYEGFLSFVHPDDRAVVDAAFRHSFRAGETRTLEHRTMTPDGVIKHVLQRWQSELDENGKFLRASGICHDITEFKEGQLRLKEQATLLEQARDAILVLNLENRVQYWNQGATRLYGWTSEEILGQSVVDLAGDAASLKKAMTAVLTKGEWLGELEQTTRDGRMILVESRRSLLRDERDNPHSILVINTDVTQQRAAERQLQQTQRLESIGKLSGGVAHDFNNLLMVIMANVEAVLDDDSISDDTKRHVERVGGAAERAARLTRQLLAFSRKQPLRPQRMNLNDLVVETSALLRRTLGANIEIDSALADDLWPTNSDRAQVEAALVNLCINSRDALPDGGRLLIETKNLTLTDDDAAFNPEAIAGDYVMLSVTDNGTGMKPDVLARAFEPFFTTKDAGKGTGLGLSMIYGFVKQSRGHITIDSTIGRGTTVKLYLPRGEPGEIEETTSPETSMLRGNERILLVEDEEQVRSIVVAQLASLGYTVTEALNGTEGLATLRAGPAYDLLLTDVIMPGNVNGKALADEAAKLHPDLPVLFMSGYSHDAISNLGILDPEIALLTKPFRKIDLAQAVRRALDTARASTAST